MRLRGLLVLLASFSTLGGARGWGFATPIEVEVDAGGETSTQFAQTLQGKGQTAAILNLEVFGQGLRKCAADLDQLPPSIIAQLEGAAEALEELAGDPEHDLAGAAATKISTLRMAGGYILALCGASLMKERDVAVLATLPNALTQAADIIKNAGSGAAQSTESFEQSARRFDAALEKHGEEV